MAAVFYTGMASSFGLLCFEEKGVGMIRFVPVETYPVHGLSVLRFSAYAEAEVPTAVQAYDNVRIR